MVHVIVITTNDLGKISNDMTIKGSSTRIAFLLNINLKRKEEKRYEKKNL